MVANTLPEDAPLPWGWLQHYMFSQQCHVTYKIKGNHEMKEHGSKYFARRHPHPWPKGSKDQNSLFSEQCHVTYKIKGNHECSNMVTNSLASVSHPPHQGVGVNRSKFHFLKTWSCYLSNWYESQMQQHVIKYFAGRPLTLKMGSKGLKVNFFRNMFMFISN